MPADAPECFSTPHASPSKDSSLPAAAFSPETAKCTHRFCWRAKIKGRKRHLLVDTLGLLIVVVVTGANLDDGTAARQLLSRVAAADFPRRVTLFGDNKYNNRTLNAGLSLERPPWRVEIQSRPTGSPGFTPVRKRWVVERTNAWVGRARRNSKDYERRASSSEAMIQISACHLMLRRLAPHNTPQFHYRDPKSAAAA